MRLREIREILIVSIPKLKIDAKAASSNSNSIQIENCSIIVDTLLELEQFNFLRNYIQEAKNIKNIFSSRLQSTIVDNSSYQSFIGTINTIALLSNAVIKAIDQVIPEQDEFSVSVKLPEINDLKQLIDFTNELDTCLSQLLINSQINGAVKLQNFESGSNWFELAVGSLPAIKAVKSVILNALDVRKKMIEVNITKQTLRALTTSVDGLESLYKGLDKSIKDLCELNAKKLINDNEIKENDIEYIGRVANSIKIMAELLSKGTEVHLALNAPKEVKEDYPDIKKLLSTITEIKQITEGDLEKEKDS